MRRISRYKLGSSSQDLYEWMDFLALALLIFLVVRQKPQKRYEMLP
ncbi:MAG: hypothetical protein ACRY3E_03410 [Candidatus Lariskella arthropodorum]